MHAHTRVEINFGNGSTVAEVDLNYRWYIPGPDPWNKLTGSSHSMPSSGEWENIAINGPTSQVRMSSRADGSVMNLDNFTNVTVGSTGSGTFLAGGYTIPQYSNIDWTVLGFSD